MQDRHIAPPMTTSAALAPFGHPPLQQQPHRNVDRQQQQSGSSEYQLRQVQAGSSKFEAVHIFNQAINLEAMPKQMGE